MRLGWSKFRVVGQPALAMAALLVLAVANPAYADVITYSPVGSGTTYVVTYDNASIGGNLANVESAFGYVVNEYQNLFKNVATINVNVQFGPNVLGESNSRLLGFTNYATAVSALQSVQATYGPNANLATALANLPVNDPTGGGSYVYTSAEAKALGLSSISGSDGTITFGNGVAYTFDPNNRQVAGAFDFIGVAEHELSEVMGRIPILGTNFGGPTISYDINDLYRFTAPGVRSLNPNDTGVYLSLNNGATILTGFNPNNGGDVDDYGGSVGSLATDPYNAFASPGQGHAITSADIANMNAIGWINTTQTPVPGALVLAMTGLASFGTFGWLTRRRKND